MVACAAKKKILKVGTEEDTHIFFFAGYLSLFMNTNRIRWDRIGSGAILDDDDDDEKYVSDNVPWTNAQADSMMKMEVKFGLYPPIKPTC
jgi:hypothetical protein